MLKYENISKTISYWLRHHPEKAGLVPDDYGWVELETLFAAFKSHGAIVDIKTIENILTSSNKKRYEIDYLNMRIRATYGHSFYVKIGDSVEPPKVLYHGTSTKSLESILKQGIVSQNREFVHLSTDIETALNVGKRHGKPVVIEIDSEKMFQEGHLFYSANDDVWLTMFVPASFFNCVIKEEEIKKSNENDDYLHHQ